MMNTTMDTLIVTPTMDPHGTPPAVVVWCVLLVILAVTSVIGNVLVLGTLWHAWTNVGTKPGNFLAFMLAVADLLNTLINLPLVIVGVINSQWALHDNTPLRMAHFFFLILLSGTSNMMLCVISINRYAVVAKPNTSEKVGRTRARNLTLYAWCHALGTAVVSIAIWGVMDSTGVGSSHHFVPPFPSQVVSYALAVGAPMAVMTVTYVRLFKRVKMRLRAVGAKKCNVACTESHMASQSVVQDAPSVFGAVKAHNMILARPNKHPTRHADLRTAVTLLILLGIFVLCWTPIVVLSLLVTFQDVADAHNYLTAAAVIVFVIPACNPLVYSMRNAQFRAAARDFLVTARERLPSQCCRRAKQGTSDTAQGEANQEAVG
ncbi:D(1B) dopamine receptor-like [Asterias amurensis]|uniref:D(1B) dopamine receptor-like n=1 Tax=Asterias amurensis TaxID=7602 RepID=UPI003AB261D7